MATIKKVKKAQKGMTMKELKMKYPDTDTTAKGDVRGTEINAYAPKKVLKKYNDTYNAFDRKFKGGPAKNKMGGVTKAKNGKSFPDLTGDGKITKADILKGRGVIAKKGTIVKKAQNGAKSPKFKMDLEKFKMQKSLDSAKAMEKVKAVEKKTVGKPNYKKGGKMTKKCMYGCK
jgi:hypothetical protein